VYISPARCTPPEQALAFTQHTKMSLPHDHFDTDIQTFDAFERRKEDTHIHPRDNIDLYYHLPEDRPEYFRKFRGECIKDLKAFVVQNITTFGAHQFEYQYGSQTFAFVMYVQDPSSTVREIHVLDSSRPSRAPRHFRIMYVVGPCAGVQYVFP
jgi:hypothetical protein